ncbi:ATP-dependent Clp protease adaptor ClpS [Actinokineospora soli]|uniref:ATP-dependent Clp protease adaptor ClpS n=1 Tax=Actinokineospora soli TaxID=1048753 RepID=A0ABW2TMG5_9PSEU
MRVLILNDNVTLDVLVAHAFTEICGWSVEQAVAGMSHVHHHGHLPVAECPDRESAEALALRFLRYGIRAVVAP